MIDFSLYMRRLVLDGLESFGRYYSSYYGFVVDNKDESGLNRLSVIVPEVFPSGRAVVALPNGVYAGKGYGIQLLPKSGDMVSIKFRHGNTDYPMWGFSNYQHGQKPEVFKDPETIGIVTPNGISILINDKEGEQEITLTTKDGTILSVKDEEIALTHNKDTKVVIKDGEVTVGKDQMTHFSKGENTQDILKDLVDIIDTWSKLISVPVAGTPTLNTVYFGDAMSIPLAKLKQDIEKSITKYS